MRIEPKERTMTERKDFDWKPCIDCGDDVHIERWRLGYRWCKFCGEDRAKTERTSWCVVQEYGKGGYMYVSAESAPITLKQTNQKNLRT